MQSPPEPWINYPEIWKTQASFMSWVRGGVRSGLWKRHPVKLEFLKESMILVKNTNTRSMKRFPMVKAAVCAICGNVTPQKDVEVDHIIGNHSLKSMDDLRSFVEAMIFVKKEDLQLVCKSCHKVKTLSERSGISFEEALTEKELIAIFKEKRDKQWLKDRGITPGATIAVRKDQIRKKLLEEKNGSQEVDNSP